MNKYTSEIVGSILGVAIVVGISSAIHIHRQKVLDRELAEAEQRANEAFEELADCVKSMDDLNRDLSVLLNSKRQGSD